MNRKRGLLKYITLTVLFPTFFIMSFALYKEIASSKIPIKINQQMDFSNKLLGHYYISLGERKYLNKNYRFDENGIPLFIIGDNIYYHPVYIIQFALGAYEYYLNTQDVTARENFLKCANWLKDNLRKHGNFYYWEYTFKNTGHPGSERIPWVSAMAQGEGASVLLRAFSETREDKYLQAAREAINPIFYDLSLGGVSIVKGENYVFPQEYPTDPPSDILNGAITAYFGVYEYYRVTNDPEIKKISDLILKTFLSVLEDYDVGYWSAYCRWPGYLASPHYNSFHVAQLRALYLISGYEEFLTYAQKFDGYQNNVVNKTRYVFGNHLRQLKELSFGKIEKIPHSLVRILRN